MSIALMTLAWKSSRAAGQKMVLLALCDNANDQGECYPSVSMLAKKCSLSERSVQQHINDMEAAGAVSREMRHGRSTVYHLHSEHFDTPATAAPRKVCTPQNLHPTPADSAPLPPQPLHPTPATAAPITIKEPSVEPSRKRQKATGTEPAAVLGVSDLEALGVEKQVAKDWLTIRKQKRCPLTATALEEFIAGVEKAGMTVPNAVRLCCGKGWAGFNASWIEKSEPAPAPRRRMDDVI